MAFNAKVTRKVIHKEWEKYMISQFTKQYAAKYGEYNKKVHSIRHEGQVVIKDKEGKRLELLDEVGMDYGTFRMKFGTSSNPTWGEEREVRPSVTQLILGKNIAQSQPDETLD
jgi:hypothetical protein